MATRLGVVINLESKYNLNILISENYFLNFKKSSGIFDKIQNLALVLLFFALSAYGQQTSVAVLPSDRTYGSVLNNDELETLTDMMRQAALKVLPTDAFVLLKQDVVIKRLGGAENYIKECTESSCIVNLGVKAQVDYVSQANVGKLGNKIKLKVELYNVRSGGLVSSLIDVESENIKDLLAIVESRVPAEVFGKIPEASRKSSAPSFAGGIGGVQIKGADYEFEEGKRHLAGISSEPEGATLSFDGMPNSRCAKTPCKAELAEGNVRIIASLEHYEIADTTVSIKQNNQGIRIRMKANFGVLEIKPAYSDGIGEDEQWNLTINGKPISSWESRLLPGKYNVELSHRCYEAISFEAGINKDKREVFDMAAYAKLKKGGLVLSAEADGEPAGEPVFVNGRQVGETPFSGSVPMCAKIEIGEGREDVDVRIKHNESVKYTHQMNTEYRRQRLKQEQQRLKQELQRLKQEQKEQKELAYWKSPWFALGGGGYSYLNRGNLYLDRENINTGGTGAFSISLEFMTVADGQLSFGMDADFGKHEFEPEEDTTVISVYFFRGGPSAKLSFGEYHWLYLTAGTSWYSSKLHSGPSFSVGGGLRHMMFFDMQYHIMPMSDSNASYWAIKGGFSMPWGGR